MDFRSLRQGVMVRLAISLLAILISASHAMAQTAGTGALEGTISDSSGAVVPNASVTATSVATGQVRTAITGQDGTYKFSLLPPGA